MRPSIVYSGFCTSDANGRPFSIGRTRSRKKSGSSLKVSSADAARIVDVFVEHAGDFGAIERVAERRASCAQPPNAMNCMKSRAFESLRLPVLHAAFFR